MNSDQREQFLKSMEKDFGERKELSSILVEDFMIHLGATTTVLLLKHLIDSTQTPEDREALKAIPDQIIDSWEKSRIQELSTPEMYAQLFQEKGSALMSPEDIQEVSKKFVEVDKEIVSKVAARLRQGFNAVKEQL